MNFNTTSWDNNGTRVDKNYLTLEPYETIKTVTLKPLDESNYSILNIEYPTMNIGTHTQDNLDVNSTTDFQSKVTFLSDMYSHNLKIFGNDNVVNGDSVMYGYVFELNSDNILELLKVKKVNDSIYTTTVATFGYGEVGSVNAAQSFTFEPSNYDDPFSANSVTSNNSYIAVLSKSVIAANNTIDIGSATASEMINNIYVKNLYATDIGSSVSPVANLY